MNVELITTNNGVSYMPVVQDSIKIDYERKGTPAKMTFSVVATSPLSIAMGNSVQLKVDGEKVFYGFVFKSSRNKDTELITYTVYDQLRYLKNKYSYIFENKTASQIIKALANDFKLQTGTITDTKLKIKSLTKTNTTLFDIIQSALDETMMSTREMYVLRDEYGKITLRNIGDLEIPILIDSQTAQDLDYSTGIDDSTYNQVVLYNKEEKDSSKKIAMALDQGNMNKWGILRYYEEVDNVENIKDRAKQLLKLYNMQTRNLKVKGAFGDWRVREGCFVVVKLKLGDTTANQWMLVDKCTHEITNSLHTMDLTLIGGDFVA